VDSPVGKIPALLPPGSWEEEPPRMDAVPALGQHSETILKALGYGESQIAELRLTHAI
jgi:crotonobetainyl-CoA:carnitine CoA-transferase CaiB-like acyl-CoA transferase